MATDELNDWLDRFAYRELHQTVDELIRRCGFPEQDRTDLLHDLIVHLLRKVAAYEPQRGHRYPFVRTVLKRYAARMCRDRGASRRHGGVASLDTQLPSQAEGATCLSQRIGQRDYDRRRGRKPRSAEELADLVSDVREVISSLPEDMRELAERLMSQSLSEIARETEIPRTTLVDAARQIRQLFEKRGLQQYLEKRRQLTQAPGRLKGSDHRSETANGE